jgi:monofunctional biosynthetic peptidoglycan transglycosylase
MILSMSTLLKLIGVAVGSLLALLLFFYLSFMVHVSALQKMNPHRTALMEDRGGKIVQTWVPLSRISRSLRNAVIVSEDGNFYNHNGIDFFEMRESFKKNLQKGKYARGFSTITMQLAKNLYLSRQKTVTRKGLEILIAWEMERKLSKERILEIYLNVVEWGRGIYGAEAASRHYFKKSAADLSADEAAFLAAILPSPLKWGQWPPGPYVARRKSAILARMGYHFVPSHEEIPELPPDLPNLVEPGPDPSDDVVEPPAEEETP